MSEIAAPALTPAAVPQERVSALSKVRRIGYALLGLQLAGLMTWSVIVYNRYSLTYDYSVYHQGWYLIAHGNLNPFDTNQEYSFWRVHGELIYWPLALFYWIWPHDLLFSWIQDFGVVAAEAVAFTWICELAGRRRAGGQAAWFAAVGLVLLVADPWIWQTVSWDFHTEPVAVLLLMLAIRDLANNRRRAFAWVLPMLLCGDVAATYLIGVGLGTVLANRRSRLRGLVVMSIGVLQFLVIALAHANLGSGHGLQSYAYLAGTPAGTTLGMAALIKGTLTHPLIALRILASRTTNMWANLGAPGFLGIFYVPILPVIAVVLLANNLWPGLLFSSPGFQSLPLYIVVPAGTVAILCWLAQRHRRTAIALSCMLVAQALAWTALWAPRIPQEWLRVSSAAAATLAGIQAMIPPGAEVVASQGIAGRFSDRTYIYAVESPGSVPVHGETWFIIAPTVGIETESTASAMAFIGQLAGPLGATLVTQANGVWVFRWDPPAGTTAVRVPDESAPLEAWVSAGAAGRAVLRGPVSGWHAAATGAEGYVADLLAWQVPAGRYTADVTLATSGPVNVEVWDDTGNAMLARRTVTAGGDPLHVTLPVNALTAYPVRVFPGWGPFRADLIAPPAGERLEVRVWSPGHIMVKVYSAVLQPAVAAPSPISLP